MAIEKIYRPTVADADSVDYKTKIMNLLKRLTFARVMLIIVTVMIMVTMSMFIAVSANVFALTNDELFWKNVRRTVRKLYRFASKPHGQPGGEEEGAFGGEMALGS